MKNYLLLSTLFFLLACQNLSQKTIHDPATAVILDWNKFALLADRHTEGFRAPVAARAYAYIGLAAWEAALPTLPTGSKSLAGQFSGLKLPNPEPGAAYNLPTVLNTCYNLMFQKIYLTMPRNIEQQRKDLVVDWSEKLEKTTDPAIFQRSTAFGKAIAEAVYDWASTDSIGHLGHLHNFDLGFVPPPGEQCWQPCADFPTPSLLPFWGGTRTFFIKTGGSGAKSNDDFLAAPPAPYSLDVQSDFYKQALEIYTLNSPLSDENQWIAEFWADDHPGLTFSSAGRWISILNQVIENEQPAPAKTLETYLKIGMAMSDAAVACWFSKYHYNLLRPETYIRRTFNSAFRPIIHTPPFPAYPAGHSMFSRAAAEVLTAEFGEKYEFTDRSHEGRTEFRGTPRSFHSFREMAAENSFSRIALGVHFRMDCEEGERLGAEIGKIVAAVQVQ